MNKEFIEAARRVCELQTEYDAADHDTTTHLYMEAHGGVGNPRWMAARIKALGEIAQRRTEAVWDLSRLLPPRELPVEPLTTDPFMDALITGEKPH